MASSENESLFLKLPLELRLEIYWYLLCSPDYIIISSRRRQLHWCRPQLPTWGLRRTSHRMPHVELLRTCKQVNSEATPILYGKNQFLVALPHLARFYPRNSFLWNLRYSTMSDLASITFVRACRGNCPEWLIACATNKEFLNIKEWTTTGRQLANLCFPHYSEPNLLPLSKAIREAHIHICHRISEDKSAQMEGYTCCRHRDAMVSRTGRNEELAPMRF
ncbi:uncharacterized protein F4812DRAFT_339484 [Daldinia caldariorum]|uniref:uncharacterized protein n=1 Tax=Daldinia caldariorum TaxID=326644 RepID=UPI0020087B27|nr:uncharacterized protein F4812DRAFT_339484 [Daldinia caldariorum]KAI1468670.1 hypothetical protein F4812DRAFT_339484 [Daldinia caldariorum]